MTPTLVEEIRSDEYETIIAAALRVEIIERSDIYIGKRHRDALEKLKKAKYEVLFTWNIQQGYLTSENRFVDEFEARDIAIAAGQCREKPFLSSGDLR